MAIFEPAAKISIKIEGGFVNNPNDKGGPTKYGISLRWMRSVFGDSVTIEDIRNLTVEKATQLYKTYWWEEYKYGLINSQSIANKVFDFSINSGPSQAHKCLQRAVRASSGVVLNDDGVIGAKTLAAVNSCDSAILLASFRSEIAGIYRFLAFKDPTEKENINGWIIRAYR